MEKELIKLTGIYKSFAGVQALQNVDFTIREGEVRCLAGENGSGKSTLIKVIAGFYEPDSGSIEINGKTFEKLTPKQAIREGVQIIYQDFAVFPNLTVAENIAITSEYKEKLLSTGNQCVPAQAGSCRSLALIWIPMRSSGGFPWQTSS